MKETAFVTLSERAKLADEHFYATVRAEFNGKEWWQLRRTVIMANVACQEAYRDKQDACVALINSERAAF